jgi:hypothetical protein
MKEAIMMNRKKVLAIIFTLTIGFVSQVSAQDEIRPLLGTDIAIVGDNDSAEHLPEQPVGYTADIEFDGWQYLVVWTGLGEDQSNWNIYGRFITTSGLFNGDFFPIADDNSSVQEDAAVAFNGVNYLVVWVERSYPSPMYPVKGQLISPSGVLIGGEIVISDWAIKKGVDVASDGTDFLVVWTRDEGSSGIVDTYAQRIKGNGTLDGSSFDISASSRYNRNPSVFFGADKYLVAWEGGEDYNLEDSRNIYGTLINANTGEIEPEFAITTGDDLQGTGFWGSGSTGISFDGTNFIVAWRSNTENGEELYVNRIDQNGQLLDGGDGILIYEDFLSGFRRIPQVAFDGNSWLVAWNHYQESPLPETLFGIRVSSNGDIIDQSPVTLSKVNDSFSLKEESPFLASDGTNYLITWKDRGEQVFQLIGSGIPTASADGPFLVTVDDSIEMDGSASFSPDGKALTYDWDFGDGTEHGTTEVVTHTYATIGNYTVTLVVNDGAYDSKPFVTSATVVGSTGGGQQKSVDSFLTFINPSEKTTQLPMGTTTYDITLVYGPTINPETLSVTLNGTPLSIFQPVAGGIESVTIEDLVDGRNTLLFMVDGIRSDGHVATDRDRLTFVVK